MAVTSAHSTHASLLQRLKQPDDELAWQRFAALYTPLLFYWARRAGLQEPDAADLVQEVFAVLISVLPKFDYQQDKTFRGWLRTVLVNKWREMNRRRRLPTAQAVECNDVPDPAFDSSCTEDEFRAELTHRALELIRGEIQAVTWEAFHQTAVLGKPPSEAAAALGLTLNAVYIARSRVLQRLRKELEGMM